MDIKAKILAVIAIPLLAAVLVGLSPVPAEGIATNTYLISIGIITFIGWVAVMLIPTRKTTRREMSTKRKVMWTAAGGAIVLVTLTPLIKAYPINEGYVEYFALLLIPLSIIGLIVYLWMP